MDTQELPDISGKTTVQALKMLCSMYPGKIIFTTSFSLEDQVVTHILCSNKLHVKIVTLDTGRLFEETYKVLARTRERYNVPIEIYFPDAEKVEKMVTQKGPFSFYESVENRIECCHIRKVIPLKRALLGQKIWITGLRSEQSNTRANIKPVEWDERYNMVKYNPIYDWSFEEVKNFITKHNIPYNVLHDRGYPSIGCAPCTRAVAPGEDIRSGRWWWENNSKKECGLHAR
ncbi:MAG: phosphoadenylyl-sulfate reductase [Prolixibacteraceae bacterium]|nr:phosphoadenylyl-sulfate reductase [Prolixibacteraceae bacterium]